MVGNSSATWMFFKEDKEDSAASISWLPDLLSDATCAKLCDFLLHFFWFLTRSPSTFKLGCALKVMRYNLTSSQQLKTYAAVSRCYLLTDVQWGLI
jgi:hypothetical protein